MWWTRCQQDLQLRQCLPGFNKINSLLCSLILPVLFGKQSLSKSRLWNSPELLGEILLSFIYFCIWSYIRYNDSSIFLIYSFCGWNYTHFGHWGLCWLLGPVFFELLTNFPTLWKALGGTSGSILYTLLVPGLDSTLGTEEKLETNVWTTDMILNAKK